MHVWSNILQRSFLLCTIIIKIFTAVIPTMTVPEISVSLIPVTSGNCLAFWLGSLWSGAEFPARLSLASREACSHTHHNELVFHDGYRPAIGYRKLNSALYFILL